MKIGWLVWRHIDNDDDDPVFMKYEPDHCRKKIQIVYIEVIEQ